METPPHSTNSDQNSAVCGGRMMRSRSQPTPRVTNSASKPTYLSKVAVGPVPLSMVVMDSKGIRKTYSPRATSIGRTSSNSRPNMPATKSHFSNAIIQPSEHAVTTSAATCKFRCQFLAEKLPCGLRIAGESMPGLSLTVSSSTTVIGIELLFGLLVRTIQHYAVHLINRVDHAKRWRHLFLQIMANPLGEESTHDWNTENFG